MSNEKAVPQAVYTRAGRAAVCGIPDDDHDCDAMGCSTLEHVLFRVPHVVDEKPVRVMQKEDIGYRCACRHHNFCRYCY